MEIKLSKRSREIIDSFLDRKYYRTKKAIMRAALEALLEKQLVEDSKQQTKESQRMEHWLLMAQIGKE